MINKIGIILDCKPYYGGSFQYAQNLLEATYCFVQKIDGILYVFIDDDDWRDYLNRYNVVVRKLPVALVPRIVFIDSEKCDLIISTSQDGWSGRLASPTVEPIHDLMHRYKPEFPEVGEEREWRRREAMFHSIAENAVGILVDSAIGKEQVCESYGNQYKDKVFILPFAAPRYLGDKSEPVDLAFSKYIFYPAQFWEHKNHENLLIAVSELKREGIIVNLIFVGSKQNAYEKVLRLIDELNLKNQVKVLGYVADCNMSFLYKNARAMIMPTFLGPTNIPPIEALTLGCPVAVSGIYGMPQQLENAALYFDPYSIVDIKNVIKSLWMNDELCKELIENGKAHAWKFTPEVFNENFYVICETISKRVNENEKEYDEILGFIKNHACLYIYGAGRVAYETYKILEQRHIYIEGLIVSDIASNNESSSLFNKKVTLFRDYTRKNGDGIICAVSDRYQNEVRRALVSRNIEQGDVYYVNENLIRLLYQNEGLY